MEASERQRLDEISVRYSEQVAEHGALWKAWTDAAEALFRAKLMGDLGGPALIENRGLAVEAAKHRLDEWEAANNWNPPWRVDSKDG
jgi:hypothetical protein